MAGHADEVIFALLQLFLLGHIRIHADHELYLSLRIKDGMGSHQSPVEPTRGVILIAYQRFRLFASQRFRCWALTAREWSAQFVPYSKFFVPVNLSCLLRVQ